MKKTLVTLLALTFSAVSYAGDGCGSGGCSSKKKEKAPDTTTTAPAQSGTAKS